MRLCPHSPFQTNSEPVLSMSHVNTGVVTKLNVLQSKTVKCLYLSVVIKLWIVLRQLGGKKKSGIDLCSSRVVA